MKEKWNYILYLIWFTYLVLTAVLMFGHGFLLSRKTLSDISNCVSLNELGCDGREIRNNTISSLCNDNEKVRRILANPGAPMVCVPIRNRVAFIIVDALRYDFTEFDPSIKNPLPYQNRLPVIHETISKYPESSRVYRFMADPPTTTLQRVKALVTGSLPTFIDASSNFAAMELQEDSTIEQLSKSGGKAVLLGDDTWERLMPKKWLRSYAMYSFHTWDLDTVDKEVDSKIYDELRKEDWNLLVAHYLGVDHAGHRYGPNHPEMARKLNETNTRLTNIIDILPSDVILYVVGDHGMTETGDHGGESKSERSAALFAYRRSGLSNDETKNGEEIKQTDFAPTLSAALGVPPPAPSLGNILLSVLPKESIPNTLLLLSNNLKQITQYLVRYGEESQQIPLERLSQLINQTREQLSKASNVNTPDELKVYVGNVRSLINEIRDVFREVWVEFDSLSMLRALLLLILVIFFNWLITEGIPMERMPGIFSSSFIPCGLIAMGLCVAFCFTAFHFELLENLAHSIFLSTGLVSGAFVSCLVILHWDGITQRWSEGQTLFHERFARIILVCSSAALASNSFIIEEGAVLNFLSISLLFLIALNIGTVKAVFICALCGLSLVISRSYRGCREEQGDCWTSGNAASSGQTSRAALILALGSMASVVAICRRNVGWRGHGIVLAGVLACAHWAVGWGTLGSPSRSRMLARFSWLVLGCMCILLWRRDSKGATLSLSVFGVLLYIANALVLGATFAPAAALAIISGFLALNVVSLMKSNGANKFSLSTRCSSSVACLWALLASYQFYGTGHHATLSHVRWAPAFHAGDPNALGTWSPMLTGILVAMELFGMPLLFGVTVPLIALWGPNGASTVGPRTQMSAVFSICLKFSLCFAIRVFAIAISATIHCRHLMIWGVFTPKLLFESGSCAAALIGTIIGAALTAWHLPKTPQKTS